VASGHNKTEPRFVLSSVKDRSPVQTVRRLVQELLATSLRDKRTGLTGEHSYSPKMARPEPVLRDPPLLRMEHGQNDRLRHAGRRQSGAESCTGKEVVPNSSTVRWESDVVGT